jgi:aminoglycoside phosphotransferase (APT) family kinase protein
MIDSTKPVRAGEELDAKKLGDWLRVQGLGNGEIAVEQFPSGHSNLTYLIQSDGHEWVLRRPPFGSKVKTAHDMGREFRILSGLAGHFPAPRPLVHCRDESVMGAQFYVMERLRGVIPRVEGTAEMRESPPLVTRLGASFVDTLKRLHQLDWRSLGFGDFGKPEGYVERQVTGWARRWKDARIDEVPDMEWMTEWLHARLPRQGDETAGAAVIHNDFKYDNLVLEESDQARIIGVLDWEMSTIGDPLMDLGTALGYWVEAGDPGPLQMARMCATTLPGSFTRHQLMERYGVDVPGMLFYYCFALWKNAVVGQQIYFRFKQGLTKDPRFEGIGMIVPMLAASARTAAETGRF